ncbi:MAG: glycosyl transferase family 28 [Chitinophagales bacterium]|nr:glycosyl transferase family 28 [Chitinophagales bacterium]
MRKQKNILISPLNWGLGHATRCIPIIETLLNKNENVLIAADGAAAQLLKSEFPDLQHLKLSGFTIQLPEAGQSLPLKMAQQLPNIFKGIWHEHKQLQAIIKKYEIKGIISDNRYGCYSKTCPSVFITHQLLVKMPQNLLLVEAPLYKLNKWFMQQYQQVWVPDFAHTNNLSGELSHPSKYPTPKSVKYIGTLSRFMLPTPPPPLQYDVLVLLSGAEPQRTYFEQLILVQISAISNKKIIIVRGITATNNRQQINPNLVIIDHLTTTELQQTILQSKVIVARSGYSTLMDLAALGKAAILVPTPEQTEQEYLADRLMQQKCYFSMPQNQFNLEKALQTYTQFIPPKIQPSKILLENTITQWLETI